ncbi:hypothetical protein [Nocardia sp. NBC_00511]|uniref:hypothetical protein n=1 Tax=Nocardia sp. NBC_00511 TaxID=2903591 RepID=UPI002F9066AE
MNQIVRSASWCEFEYRTCADDCPLNAAEARLREVHRHWHDCARSYQDPEDFRVALNSTIQALRNVTFALQAAKSAVPNFSSWYEPQQTTMRADKILRWIVDSRNKVVKQGDLETHSRLNVAFVIDYTDEADLIAREQRTWDEFLRCDYANMRESTAQVPVGMSAAEILSDLRQLDLPLMVRQRASVLFERRWVSADMPGYELLTVLAHAYGRLRELVLNCHELLDRKLARVAVSIGDDGNPLEYTIEEIDRIPFRGGLQCMLSTRNIRTTRRRLVDGTVVTEFISHRSEFDPDIQEVLDTQKPYGEHPDFPTERIGKLQTSEQLAELVEFYRELASGILRSGQDHACFTHYFRNGAMCDSRLHMTIDSQGKHALASEIALIALENQADVVVIIGEAWTAPFQATVDGGHVPPQYHPDRGECLFISAVARSGATAGMTLPFTVLDGVPPHRQIEIGTPSHLRSVNGMLIPTQHAWNQAQPSLTGEAFWRAQTRKP